MNNETFFTSSVFRKCLVALRGVRSQGQLARRCGFHANQISHWETGRRQMGWDHFVSLAHACGADLSSALYKLSFFKGDPRNLPVLISSVIGSTKVSTSGHEFGVSSHSIASWMSGVHKPSAFRVLQFFARVDKWRFLSFLNHLVDLDAHLSVLPEWQEFTELRTFSRHSHLGQIVIAAIASQAYVNLKSHEKGWFSRFLNVTEDEEEKILENLIQLKLIDLKDGKYKLCKQKRFPDHFEKEVILEKMQFWMRELSKQTNPNAHHGRWDRCLFGEYALSKSAFEKVSQAAKEYRSKVIQILEEDTEHPSYLLGQSFLVFEIS